MIRITSLPESKASERGPGNRGRGPTKAGTDETTDRAWGTDDSETDSATDRSEAGVTFDYGISVVNVRNRGLTVSDLFEYRASDEKGTGVSGTTGTTTTDHPEGTDTETESVEAGIAYDWYVTDDDVTGVGTDHEKRGVGPDEAWLLLKPTGSEEETTVAEGETTTSTTDTDDEDTPTTGAGGDGTVGERGEASTGTAKPDPSVVDGLTPVFRTMYADKGTNEWHTRKVTDEFRDIEGPPWKRFSKKNRKFVRIGFDLLDAYGDATVHAVGVGRGDPLYGPSKLDTYYSDLYVNGERYELPTTYGRGDRGRDRGRGQNRS
ncbi:hypothetical protein [Halosimplex amylolyticum]|uniref:hypothetical protein n=1 Tax=Halosimplex amylolyticum TaxID=3396616 RepID=UPI003F543568